MDNATVHGEALLEALAARLACHPVPAGESRAGRAALGAARVRGVRLAGGGLAGLCLGLAVHACRLLLDL